MIDRPDNVTRLPVQPRLRMLKPHRLTDRVRGAAADIRECLSEHTPDLDGLREIARRLDSVADDLEGI